jgi:uncharacterized membrane protein YgaE (UPF0421/DUF939 family)
MDGLKAIMFMVTLLVLVMIGSMIGMVMGAVVFPMKILDERNAGLSEVRSMFTKTDSNKDQI